MKNNLFLALIVIGSIVVFSRCDGQGEELMEEGPEATEVQAERPGGAPMDEMPEPPRLVVLAGEEPVEVIRGTYSWSIDNEDGTITAVETDTAAPPDLVQGMTPTTVSIDTIVELNFEVEPDNFRVRTWEEDYTVSSTRDDVLLTREGLVIYEVRASWAQGKASYAFVLEIE